MPAGIVNANSMIVKQNSKTNTANNVQESLSLDDFLDGIKFICDYILSQKKKKNNSKNQYIMWYLYLDESGDLGFDFVNKKPSKFFTVTILAMSSYDANRKMIKAVKKTLARKINPRNKRKRIAQELKGSSMDFKVKKYFYKQTEKIKFGVYSITLNKRKVYERLIKNKSRVYNWIAKKVLDKIPFEKNNGDRVEFIIDKSMGKPEIEEFNSYIRRALESRLSPEIPLDIYHWISHEIPGLQAADVFCWGIFQKYERENMEWLNIYLEKIKFEELFL